MLSKYCGSLVLVLGIVCGLMSTLPFATRSHVRAGEVVDETLTHDVTFGTASGKYYKVNAENREEFAKTIEFSPSGVVQIKSATVELTPKEVSWDGSNRTSYKAPGARAVSHIVWQTPADAPNGAAGEIEFVFVKVPGFGYYDGVIRSGGYQKLPDGRVLVREVKTYRSSLALAVARFNFVFSAGLGPSLLLHGIWWIFVLRKYKRERVAELSPPEPRALPREFYPNPIAEWFWWLFVAGVFGFLGTIFASMMIYEGYESSSLDTVMIVIQAIGLVIGGLVVWGIRRSVKTVRVDHQHISIAKGRSANPQWLTARWNELRNALVKTQTYKGNTSEWLEFIFPDGTKRKVPQDTVDYEVLKEIAAERYTGTGSTP